MPAPQEISAPHLGNFFFRVPAFHEFVSHIECFGGVVPAVDAATTIEVGADANIVNSNQIDGVVDMIDKVPNISCGEFEVDLLGNAVLELGL